MRDDEMGGINKLSRTMTAYDNNLQIHSDSHFTMLDSLLLSFIPLHDLRLQKARRLIS